MPTVFRNLENIINKTRRVLPVSEAAREWTASVGLMAMLGVTTRTEIERTFVRVSLFADDRCLGDIEATIEDRTAHLGEPRVDRSFRDCGLENGLRAIAIQTLRQNDIDLVEVE